ncbi:hypothetical protein e1012e08.tmp0181 [Eimeria tenella]|uniref:Uncharacterized protein n=1 Tax=Eimeria tenella TaxID=5802 RepID=C8TDL3_EIMTE|nr:hypothetical protein e1012e08.tmp0181 [Eimeria tenella]
MRALLAPVKDLSDGYACGCFYAHTYIPMHVLMWKGAYRPIQNVQVVDIILQRANKCVNGDSQVHIPKKDSYHYLCRLPVHKSCNEQRTPSTFATYVLAFHTGPANALMVTHKSAYIRTTANTALVGCLSSTSHVMSKGLPPNSLLTSLAFYTGPANAFLVAHKFASIRRKVTTALVGCLTYTGHIPRQRLIKVSQHAANLLSAKRYTFDNTELRTAFRHIQLTFPNKAAISKKVMSPSNVAACSGALALDLERSQGYKHFGPRKMPPLRSSNVCCGTLSSGDRIDTKHMRRSFGPEALILPPASPFSLYTVSRIAQMQTWPSPDDEGVAQQLNIMQRID